ncbi:unnamed protein product [Mytilus edulis]|uniref:Uncharacterized protein n=1 Tax=Mytilus edulis TaxID=6550 RepID=A0A8S3SWT6_MYTED|nr:unnamed protein product [Mytilus edulis]
MPSTSKHHTDIDSRGNIKIDHSTTYQENSFLSDSLESKIASLHKAKFRASIDNDDALKEARKEAEEISRLSSAIKRGEIKDSVSLYDRRSHTPKSRDGTPHTTEVLTYGMQSSSLGSRPQTHVENNIRRDSDKPPVSTLTMFAISMQKLTSSKSSSKNDTKVIHKNIQGYRSFMTLRCLSSPAYLRKERSKRQRRPALVRFQDLKDGEVMEAQDIPVMKPEVAYAMQLRKRQIRSRRELTELSKIETEEKYGKPDKTDEFKQKRYAWAKGNDELNTRIRSFLVDVETFNKRQRKPDYLMTDIVRSKTCMV